MYQEKKEKKEKEKDIQCYHQTHVQDHIQQKPHQPTALNMARCRKAVNGALGLQLAVVVC